jgi:hypothetical protein
LRFGDLAMDGWRLQLRDLLIVHLEPVDRGVTEQLRFRIHADDP